MDNNNVTPNLHSAGLKGTRADSAADIQAALTQCTNTAGLHAALDLLDAWCHASGYLPQGWADDDEIIDISPVDDEPTLQLQINRSRARYVSPASGFARDQAANDCPLCAHNTQRPGKELLRLFHFQLAGRDFFVQHTPFPFHETHFVLVEATHQPMRMAAASVADLAAFLDQAPHATACSNSDVMWAGASILAHHHYQVFSQWDLPVMVATLNDKTRFTASGTRATIGLLNYPAAVVRVQGPCEDVVATAGTLIMAYKATAPGKATANLVASRPAGSKDLQVEIILRHSDHRTTSRWTDWKAEGVGVLEMAGLVIVPAPRGEHADDRLDHLRANAGTIARGILTDNSPVNNDEAPALLETLRESLSLFRFLKERGHS